MRIAWRMTALTALAVFMSTMVQARRSGVVTEGVGEEYRPVMESLLEWIESEPPLLPHDPERREKLLTIDPLFMMEDALISPVVRDYFQARVVDAFFESFEAAEVEEGVVIWKLYNECLVVKTPETVFAFDIIYGWGSVRWSDEDMDRLLDIVDVMFLSHRHGDHADAAVAAALVEKGKTVVVPPGVWEDEEFYDELMVVRDGVFDLGPISFLVYPAFQKQTKNNIYVATTPDGVSVMHTGDENEVYFFANEWYRHLDETPHIDVLMVNCWSPDVRNLIEIFDPRIIVSIHEHEMGHRVSGRRPYSFVYGVFDNFPERKVLIPAWGESLAVLPLGSDGY